MLSWYWRFSGSMGRQKTVFWITAILKVPIFVHLCANKSISLQKAFASNDLLQTFRFPMSRTSYNLFFRDNLNPLRIMSMQGEK
jgi:hypothetical protein